MTDDLPEAIKEDIPPILMKYGMTDPTMQGKTCIAIGSALKRAAYMIRVKVRPKVVSRELQNEIVSALEKNGMTDNRDRINCSIDVIRYIDSLIRQLNGGGHGN